MRSFPSAIFDASHCALHEMPRGRRSVERHGEKTPPRAPLFPRPALRGGAAKRSVARTRRAPLEFPARTAFSLRFKRFDPDWQGKGAAEGLERFALRPSRNAARETIRRTAWRKNAAARAPNFRREPPFLCGSSASIPIGKGKEPLRALSTPQRLLHF